MKTYLRIFYFNVLVFCIVFYKKKWRVISLILKGEAVDDMDYLVLGSFTITTTPFY